MSSPGQLGPLGPAGYTIREWEYNSNIRTFFWNRGNISRMLNHQLANDEELAAWCDEYSCNLHGVWVECPDDETAMLFALRWA